VSDSWCRVWLGLFGAIAFSEGVMAHGVTIKTQMNLGVEVQAFYDEGQPLAQAQVQVFSPANAETALFTGQTDKDGRYQFTPTASGDWEILVRQSGHGESLTVPIDLGGKPLQSLASSGSDNLIQRLITLGSVIWGCVGTALYFKGRSA
jgi:nickel transport protein